MERLKARPAWRACNQESYWKPQVAFNEWFKNNHTKVNPKIDLIDTTNLSVEKTEEKVKAWINLLNKPPLQ